MGAQSLNHHYAITLFTNAVSTISKISITNCLRVILFFSFSVSSPAQPKFKVFDTESGLSNTNVTGIVQDQSGYLWVGTRNGLHRFDGSSFKVFRYSSHDKNTISGNHIKCLAVDKFNRIWIGHDNGVTCYDPSAHRFTRYRFRSTDNGTTFISFDKDNRVWVGINGSGLIVLNPETGAIERRIDLTPFINKNYDQRVIQEHNVVNGMLEESTGNIWLATQDGLYLYDRKLDAVKPVRVVEDSPTHRDDFFTGILDDKNGGFWLASYQGGVCHYSPKQNLFSTNQSTARQYDSDRDFSLTNKVQGIAWRSENELWLITRDKEKPIGTFDIQTKTFSFLGLSDIFGSEIKATELLFGELFVDRTGVVWVASKLGLVMINPENSWDYKPIFKTDFPVKINAIVEDTIFKKRFIATTGSGLLVSNTNDTKVRSYRGRKDPYTDIEYIRDLLDTGGDSLWVISRGNIRLFDKVREKWIDLPELQKLEAYVGSVMNPSFSKMIKASSGDYWIATLRNGAYRLRGSDLSFVHFKDENSIGSIYSLDLLEDKFGRIWFASRNAGIRIFDPVNNTFKSLNIENKGSSFLPSNDITRMDIDKEGNVWLASYEVGIIKINVVSKDSLHVVTFDNELLTSPSFDMKIDGQGRVWFRSFGVHMLDPKTMNIKSFEKRDGLFNTDQYLLKSNNRVLVNGSAGFGLIGENDLLPDTTSNPLVINSIKVFGKEIFPQGVNNNHIELPYDQNSITIDFAAIDFLYGKKINYSYKLEGLKNNEWTTPSSNRSTEFAHLAGGDYIFKLRASNQEGVWSMEKSLLYIHIETPFWETTWFYSLVSGLLIAVIALTYWYQIKRIKTREKERSEANKRISQLQLKALHTQMRPHFIFNCLSAINSHIIKFETVKASEFLSQFSRLMRRILENSTESWITLEQEIETLRLYLNMEGLRFEEKLSFKIEVEEGIDPSNILIPSMIIQPYVENAIGHGLLHKEHGPGKVSIKFLKGDGNIKCVIEDNGIGRERANQIRQRSRFPHKSLGLQITSERLQLLQGSSVADIQDLKNDLGEPVGTRIIVMLMTRKVEDKELANLN